jgi:hypothetical protein
MVFYLLLNIYKQSVFNYFSWWLFLQGLGIPIMLLGAQQDLNLIPGPSEDAAQNQATVAECVVILTVTLALGVFFLVTSVKVLLWLSLSFA